MKTVDIILLIFSCVIAIGLLAVLFKGLAKTDKPGYLDEPDGKRSSERLWGHLILGSFFMFNFMFFSLLTENPNLLKGNLELLYYMLIFDMMLLIAVYVPKYLIKMKELVSGFRNGDKPK